MTRTPEVIEVRRDVVSREIRLELADWRTRTGGLHDLPQIEQQEFLIEGHLPGMGLFLPEFVIVLGTGEPVGRGDVVWNDVRVHVGGVSRDTADLAARDWSRRDELLHGTYSRPRAPGWLLRLIDDHTPWGFLVNETTRR